MHETSKHISVSQHVDALLDTIRNARLHSIPDRIHACRQLAQQVLASVEYTRQAELQRASDTLTRALATTLDESLLQAIAEALTACSGTGARGMHQTEYCMTTTTTTSTIPSTITARVQELAIDKGVGMRIWAAAVVLCRELCTHPSFVRNLDLLEVGAGCGLCGLVAEQLGAKSVTLSDYETSVLDNLATSVDVHVGEERDMDWTWRHGTLLVRHLSWGDDQAALESGKDKSIPVQHHHDHDHSIPVDQKFPRIIGSDLMYEETCCVMLAHAIRRRLAPHGACLLVNAIRQACFLTSFVSTAERLGLVVRLIALNPHDQMASDGTHGFSLRVNGIETDIASSGIMARGGDYIGGYQLFLINHAESPFDWTTIFHNL